MTKDKKDWDRGGYVIGRPWLMSEELKLDHKFKEGDRLVCSTDSDDIGLLIKDAYRYKGSYKNAGVRFYDVAQIGLDGRELDSKDLSSKVPSGDEMAVFIESHYKLRGSEDSRRFGFLFFLGAALGIFFLQSSIVGNAILSPSSNLGAVSGGVFLFAGLTAGCFWVLKKTKK